MLHDPQVTILEGFFLTARLAAKNRGTRGLGAAPRQIDADGRPGTAEPPPSPRLLQHTPKPPCSSSNVGAFQGHRLWQRRAGGCDTTSFNACVRASCFAVAAIVVSTETRSSMCCRAVLMECQCPLVAVVCRQAHYKKCAVVPPRRSEHGRHGGARSVARAHRS